MLTENEIRRALHAGRVVALAVPNPHGPLGLEQRAAAVAHIVDAPVPRAVEGQMRRPIALSVAAWTELERLARTTGQAHARSVTASEIATAIIEQFVAATTNPATEAGHAAS